MAPDAGLFTAAVREIEDLLRQAGVADAPLGVDIAEPLMICELQRQGFTVADGQHVMLDARQIKSADEIMLLSTAAAMVDGVYFDIAEALRPGVRENELVALANKRLYEMVPTTSRASTRSPGERCNPYRTFAVGAATPSQQDAYQQCREWIDTAIDLVRPGVGTDELARAWPKAEDFEFSSEYEAFGLQFGHGLGLALHERPIISRLNSLEHPVEIKEGMVFALETCCPADDGHSAAGIEEELVVTSDGAPVIALYPAQDLPIANAY